MPAKNVVRAYDSPAYYHIYNRGANKSAIFLDDKDRAKFLSLIDRHLDPELISKRSDGQLYEKYDVQIPAYCLMDNHFHLLAYQWEDKESITKFLKSITTAYTMYFNKKYRHSGALFQGVFKASRISDDSYLLHITRYIHLNPRRYLGYQWSSIRYYLGASKPPAWLRPRLVSDMSPEQYKDFVQGYEGKKAELELLKHQLAI